MRSFQGLDQMLSYSKYKLRAHLTHTLDLLELLVVSRHCEEILMLRIYDSFSIQNTLFYYVWDSMVFIHKVFDTF